MSNLSFTGFKHSDDIAHGTSFFSEEICAMGRRSQMLYPVIGKKNSLRSSLFFGKVHEQKAIVTLYHEMMYLCVF